MQYIYCVYEKIKNKKHIILKMLLYHDITQVLHDVKSRQY